MALASAYAISGLSQSELCSSIYGTSFQEDPVQVLSLSECIPPDVFLNRWVWSDLSSETMLLIPLDARISDVKRAEAQLARDQDRAVRHYPPRWQDVTLRFAAKVLHLSGKSFGERGHYERLLHERHWTLGHNACKGAKTDSELRLGHVPGIYTSWREAQPHTIGIPSDVKRFSTRHKAEEYMSKSTGPGDPLLENPSAFLFTDGSALPNGSAGWGVHITFPGREATRAIWGPVSTSPTGGDWIGARRATSNTGELSAFYHALDWIRRRRASLDPASTPSYNLVSDSFYCVKLFATRAIKPVANKQLISRINALLDQVKRDNSISISWTPAHTNSDDPLALGNAEADRLAAR
eukprot:gene17816-12766_t